jgi:hypothetical protein
MFFTFCLDWFALLAHKQSLIFFAQLRQNQRLDSSDDARKDRIA